MSAPKRLLEDPETAAALRADLQTVASHQVDFDVAASLARFEATLALLPASAGLPEALQANTTGSAAAAGVKATLLKLGVLGVVAGGAVLGVMHFSGNDPRPHLSTSAHTPAKTEAAVATPPRKLSPTEAPSTPAISSPETAGNASSEALPNPAHKPAARPSLKPTPKPAAPPAETRDDLLAREVQQLRQIRQLVGGNPSQALALANQGHATFKGGVLYQEREALALQALSALGRRSELEARGERYLRAFPNGSFSARVRQLIGR